MDTKISLPVNGKPRIIITTDPETCLLGVLRKDFQFTGTKFGCGESQCRVRQRLLLYARVL